MRRRPRRCLGRPAQKSEQAGLVLAPEPHLGAGRSAARSSTNAGTRKPAGAFRHEVEAGTRKGADSRAPTL
jgi:hypothetical protein